jgi:hypothetical protein
MLRLSVLFFFKQGPTENMKSPLTTFKMVEEAIEANGEAIRPTFSLQTIQENALASKAGKDMAVLDLRLQRQNVRRPTMPKADDEAGERNSKPCKPFARPRTPKAGKKKASERSRRIHTRAGQGIQY